MDPTLLKQCIWKSMRFDGATLARGRGHGPLRPAPVFAPGQDWYISIVALIVIFLSFPIWILSIHFLSGWSSK